MGILDKLRPQSKSTHPDPDIRIEAIHELDSDDIASLNAFAKDDTDARVRRVAVARIGDASVLADVVRNETEGSVRDHALTQLVEQASKHDPATAMTAVAALASLGRDRELVQVAKAPGPDEVRRAAIAAVRAIDRLTNPTNDTLTAISDKARTKAAQKKARTLIRAATPAAPVESGPV